MPVGQTAGQTAAVARMAVAAGTVAAGMVAAVVQTIAYFRHTAAVDIVAAVAAWAAQNVFRDTFDWLVFGGGEWAAFQPRWA